jgi:hypothetical protein
MPDSDDQSKSMYSKCRRVVEIDVIRPLGDQHAPDAGDERARRAAKPDSRQRPFDARQQHRRD